MNDIENTVVSYDSVLLISFSNQEKVTAHSNYLESLQFHERWFQFHDHKSGECNQCGRGLSRTTFQLIIANQSRASYSGSVVDPMLQLSEKEKLAPQLRPL